MRRHNLYVVDNSYMSSYYNQKPNLIDIHAVSCDIFESCFILQINLLQLNYVRAIGDI